MFAAWKLGLVFLNHQSLSLKFLMQWNLALILYLLPFLKLDPAKSCGGKEEFNFQTWRKDVADIENFLFFAFSLFFKKWISTFLNPFLSFSFFLSLFFSRGAPDPAEKVHESFSLLLILTLCTVGVKFKSLFYVFSFLSWFSLRRAKRVFKMERIAAWCSSIEL